MTPVKQERNVTVANTVGNMDKVIMPCNMPLFALDTNIPFFIQKKISSYMFNVCRDLSKAQCWKFDRICLFFPKLALSYR